MAKQSFLAQIKNYLFPPKKKESISLPPSRPKQTPPSDQKHASNGSLSVHADATLKRYAQQEDELRAGIDAYYNIHRSVEKAEDKETYPTGYVVFRDATHANPVGTPDTSLQVEANNALLRVLGRLRGIDYTLMEKSKSKLVSPAEKEIYSALRETLSADFENLIAEISAQTTESAIKALEETFNTEKLCAALHQANLDEGCRKAKDYEKLLFHYRNLSCLIEPARSLVTIAYDEKNNVLHRITQRPVAKAVPEQLKKIVEMRHAVLFPTKEELNYQTRQKMAFQEANVYFADLLLQPDRMPSSQMRKTHPPKARNAFLVKNELIFLGENKLAEDIVKRNDFIKHEPAKLENTQYFMRSATPVYVGKGESDDSIQQNARANIQQMREFSKRQISKDKQKLEGKDADEYTQISSDHVSIHVTSLVTDTPIQSGDKITNHLYRATRYNTEKPGDHISYLPCNMEGTLRSPEIVPDLISPESDVQLDRYATASENSLFLPDKEIKTKRLLPTPFNQAARYKLAAEISNKIRAREDMIELPVCASGQDRTETESRYATQLWAENLYRENKCDAKQVERTQTLSRNSAEINAHTIGGSRGCKNASRGRGLYSAETDRAMYLASAETNKKNFVNKKMLATVLKNTSPIATLQLENALTNLRTAIDEENNAQLKSAGKNVLKNAEQLQEKIKHKDIGTLTRTINQTTAVIKTPGDGNTLQRYGAIITGLEKKNNPWWRKLAKAMLILGGAALVVGGILFAFPSGGSSILVSLLAAKMLIAIAGGATAVAGATVSTMGMYAHRKETALIKSLKKVEQHQDPDARKSTYKPKKH